MSGADIITGLEEALAHAKGDQAARVKDIKVPEHVDVKRLRKSLGLTQEEFATRFKFQLSAIQNWEQGRRFPNPSAVILLRVIEADADLVADVLEKHQSLPNQKEALEA